MELFDDAEEREKANKQTGELRGDRCGDVGIGLVPVGVVSKDRSI